MKRLIQSAFALSLMLTTPQIFAQTEAIDDFLGLETELMPDLEGAQRFTPENLHHNSEDWNVSEKDAVIDKEPLKGQNHSVIPWKTMDPEAWLSVDIWIKDRAIKDKNPDWKMRIRDSSHLELVAKILKCVGECPVFHGTFKTPGQHLSRLREGDEIRTGKNSSAWLYLMDGTLVRMGAESSISLHEINFGKTENFILARLNQGHVFWHPRSTQELKLEEAPETDPASLPLLVREANQEHFERDIFSKQNSMSRQSELMDMNTNAITAQVKEINRLRSLNEISVPTKVMLVAPNATLISRGVSFNFIHMAGGKSYFKKTSPEVLPSDLVELHLRGYNNLEAKSILTADWQEVEVTGRTHQALENPPGELQVSELITKRIKSLELAREIWFLKFTKAIYDSRIDPKKMAVDYGYNLWGEESSKRLEYLVEYTRRIETTNLISVDNLLQKLEKNGEVVQRELTSNHYQFSLNFYLKSLKSRYTNKKLQVREMNDLQYYVWILKNGKI